MIRCSWRWRWWWGTESWWGWLSASLALRLTDVRNCGLCARLAPFDISMGAWENSSLDAPVAQRIERWPPEPKAQVRVLAGVRKAPAGFPAGLFLCLGDGPALQPVFHFGGLVVADGLEDGQALVRGG